MNIGLFVSYGLGGADKSSYYLAKGFKELGQNVIVFYSDYSFPKLSSQWDEDQIVLSRWDQYADFTKYKIEEAAELNNFKIDIL